MLRDTLKPALAALASQGVFVGTSSWKYPGWRGQIYDEQRYIHHKKFSVARFERTCLAEYAETFPTVCVDGAYYQFPSEAYLAKLTGDVPPDFKFTLKVTDEITIRNFPNLPRFGPRAGTSNSNFLNAGLFQSAFLRPCETVRPYIGVLIFEFSRFHAKDFEHGRDFVAALEAFLAQLPKTWRYGVEMRNRQWLQPDYFAALAQHNVAHVFNSWSAMPSIAEQLAMPGIETADFSVARFLLKPGRTYEQSVKLFEPYTETKEVVEDAREAGKTMIRQGKAKARPTFIYVNNRLEGSAPSTIRAMLDASDSAQPSP